MGIGERIQNLRTINGLTQEQLAEKLNVSRQSISKWEMNQSVPETEK
ncbi:MAG: helix-turn-helix domain-containing protein, partial [Lachnospiraceae bacterium]|nr:helix-turn-helix domain-containing protein [Lachnospiraceae bacterium]